MENRKKALEQLATASPLEITHQLETFELYDMKTSQTIIDEVYEEFQTKKHLESSVLKPVFMSVIDSLLEATKAGRVARKKGLTASRVVSECEAFRYDDEGAHSSKVDVFREHINLQNDRVNPNMSQEYNAELRNKTYEDKQKMDKYKLDRVVGEKSLHDEYDVSNPEYAGLYLERKNPNKVYKDETFRKQANTDHIVPLKQVHEQLKGSYALDDADVKEIANIEDNFAVTSAGINQAKKDKTNEQYIEHMEEKGTPLDKITQKNMIKMQKKAESKVTIKANKQVAKNVVAHSEKGKDIRKEVSNSATEQAKDYAVGNVILFIVKPIYFELKDSFKHGIKEGVAAATTIEALKIRFGRIKRYVLNNVAAFLGDNLWAFVKGFISSLIEGIISLFIGVFRQVLRLVKEGIKIFAQSAKILFGKDAKQMTASQKGDAIIKILGGSVIAISGIGIEALLNKIGIGRPFSVVISTLLSGIASALFMYVLDKVDLFSVKPEQRRDRIREIFNERIATIKTAANDFNIVAIETLQKQQEQFTKIEEDIQFALETDNIALINPGLYDMAELFNVDLPYSNTDEFIDYFDSSDVIKL